MRPFYMLQRSTLQLLRFHFSLFLLPVYLFALSQLPEVDWSKAALVFVILHLMVYPSSNGYNSYMDRDEAPIGGLARPLQPTKQLFYVSVWLDVLALLLSFIVHPLFGVGVLLYIVASRAYSYRGIRLKQYPIIGFLTVFIFQGAAIFYSTYTACAKELLPQVSLLACFIASLLIGALYPLTQVYQHEADQKDGVTTISYVLGKRGSFLFSGVLFSAATGLLYLLFNQQGQLNYFFLFLLFNLPVVLFFLYWAWQVWKNEQASTFKNSLWMNVVATVCTTSYFTTLNLLNHFE